uniref:Orf3 3' of attP site protein n=1 Tax=Prevotella phage phi AR29 TaxID=45332 RepID=Q38570_9VIRU|nr:orf3 3' of attP site [Prevotella phage phi AR29]
MVGIYNYFNNFRDFMYNLQFGMRKRNNTNPKYLYQSIGKTREEFYKDITERKNLILRLYTDHKIETSEQLNQYIDEYINPEKYINKESSESLHNRLNLYIEQCYKDGIFGEGRKKHYDVLLRELNRFSLSTT